MSHGQLGGVAPRHRYNRSVWRAPHLAVLALALATAGACSQDSVSYEARTATGQLEAPAAGDLDQGGLLPASPSTSERGGAADSGQGDGQAPGGGPGAAGSGTGGSEPIRVGTILPLQGGERELGEPVLRTTQAFVDELNARGGILGRSVELVAYSACLLCQTDALTAARRLVEQDRVFALVNTYVMVVAFQTVIPYLTEQGVPLIQGGSFSQTSDALSPVNFATAPTGSFYGRWLPVTAARRAKMRRVAIAYLDVPSEAGGLPVLRRELEREGLEVVAEASVDAAEEAVTNMDSIVTRFRVAGADGVVALDPAVLVFGRLAARRQGWDGSWVGPAAWSSLVETGCGQSCDTNVFTDTAGLSFIDRDTPQMRQYLDTMARRYPGGQTTGHTLAAWVGMQLFIEGLVRAGAPDQDAFLASIESIRGLDLGTTSPLTFTPDRHLGGSSTVPLHLAGGRFVAGPPEAFGEAAP